MVEYFGAVCLCSTVCGLLQPPSERFLAMSVSSGGIDRCSANLIANGVGRCCAREVALARCSIIACIRKDREGQDRGESC